MKSLNIITGTEQALEGSPEAALIEFYRAFNGSDFTLMQQNWLPSPGASMSNPLGGIKRGWEEIRSVYRSIFEGPAEVYVEYYDFQLFRGERFFQAVGRERGFFRLGKKELPLRIRTSRSYVWDGERYRQLHHHGSIEDAQLLQAYQDAVRG